MTVTNKNVFKDSRYICYVKQPVKFLKPRLAKLDIELTERCNNRCIHCYINQPENEPEIAACEMSTVFVKDILRQATELGCLTVRFTGGEPLLRKDFVDLYLYARRLGLRVAIYTNARLITVKLAELFARIPPREPIEVSVYGMRPASYDQVAAVPGAFEQFWQGIILLRQYRVPFIVKQSLLPQNRDELQEFTAFAAAIPQMNGHNPGFTMNFDLRTRRDNEAKNRFIKRLRISPQDTLAMLTREPDKYIAEMREFARKFMRPSGDLLFCCGAGLGGACVDAYGQVQMCMLLRHPSTVYPLEISRSRQKKRQTKLSPLKYALNEFFPRIRRIRAANPEYLNRCAVCFLKGLCEQCPAKSWQEHGTIDTPVEYLCQLAHTQAAWLGLVSAGEKAWELSSESWQARLNAFIHGAAKGPLP